MKSNTGQTIRRLKEENKRLHEDIKLLSSRGLSAERVLLIDKWRKYFDNQLKDKKLNDLLNRAILLTKKAQKDV